MITTMTSSATSVTSKVSSQVIVSEQGMTLSGALVFSSVADLVEQGNQIFKKYRKEDQTESIFVIDCKAMERIDSAGIALLIEWQRQCKNHNASCRFEGLSNQAKALIEAYRLQSIISA